MLPLSSISLHQLGARPGCGPNAATPRAVVSSAMLTPAFVGSDFPSLKAANSNKKKKTNPELNTLASFCTEVSSVSASTFKKKKKKLRIFSVSMEILERYLPQRYVTRVLIYIFPNDCHFWPETVTTRTTMTHSKCQHETT